MTVLPVKSTRLAPGGAWTVPRRPTRVNRAFSTRNAESSIGAPPSPVMRRAPSYKAAAASRCVEAGEAGRIARSRPPSSASLIDCDAHHSIANGMLAIRSISLADELPMRRPCSFRGRLRLPWQEPVSAPGSRGCGVQLETMYSSVDGRVATLVLNRPDVLNCANEQWARDLGTLVDDLAAGKTSAWSSSAALAARSAAASTSPRCRRARPA